MRDIRAPTHRRLMKDLVNEKKYRTRPLSARPLQLNQKAMLSRLAKIGRNWFLKGADGSRPSATAAVGSLWASIFWEPAIISQKDNEQQAAAD